MSRSVQKLLLSLLAIPSLALAGPNVALDNILLSKVNGVTKVEIWPGCKMRYVDHVPQGAALELRIRVLMDPECGELFSEVSNERYLQSDLRMGNVREIEFDRLNDRDTFITLHFNAPQVFEVRQHQIGWIEVYVDTNLASAGLPASKPPPLVSPAPATSSSSSIIPPTVVDRRSAPQQQSAPPQPSKRVNVPPSNEGDYVVQLGVFANPGQAVAELERSGSPHFSYSTRFEINAQTWHGLQLGFFDSEAEAEAVLADFAARFPDAWVRFVSDEERQLARSGEDIRDSIASDIPAVRVTRARSLDDATLASSMSDGRMALLDQRYDDAIRLYTSVLQSPGHDHGPEAREMLAIALERSGRTEAALAEYRAFLVEYPGHMMSARVGERLTTLELASGVASTPFRGAPVANSTDNSWQVNGGISHYYWRNQEQVVHDGNYLVSGSGVLGLAHVTAARRGDRFDILTRFNGAYQHNLVEYDTTGDVGWVSDAYIDVNDREWDLRARVGRQTRRQDGIPGRFDGAGLAYAWKPDLTFSVSAGVPVDSPRYVTSSSRAVVAGSIRASQLWDGRIDASVFATQQVVDGILDGILDRQAVGGELVFTQGNLTAVSLVDFDVSYNVLNTFLVNSTYRLDNGWSVSGYLDVGALPWLTTRNALSGQSATTIDELLETYSEGQLRTLARDRTAQAIMASAGISIPMGERFDVSFDVSMRESEGTVESGDVAAIPATGAQLFVNAMLVGTSLLRENDLLTLTLRSSSTLSRDSNSLIFDSRLPFGRTLRISPRLTVTQHSPNVDDVSEQFIVTPAIRLLYRWKKVLLDLEAGGRWSNRELPPFEFDPFTPDGTEELLGGYVNVGYRLEF
jgi:hypothetical protein